MKKSSANLSRIAARAAENRPVSRHSQTGPLRAAEPLPKMTGPVRRTRCAPMTGAQQSGNGGRSLWSASMTLSGRDGLVAHDRKWDRTVNS